MNKNNITDEWLELAEAADILGVHFTTLRRWADSGKVPHMRTVSGRRRFNRAVLEKLAQPDSNQRPAQTIDTTPLEVKTLDRARQNTQGLTHQPGGWIEHLNEEQRIAFRYGGQRLLGLLMQFTSRGDGEPFVNEGKRMAHDYGELCYRANMSVVDLVQAFLFFRRSILESLYATTTLVSQRDPEGLRLFERVNEFFDLFLLTMIDRFVALKDQQVGLQPGPQIRNE